MAKSTVEKGTALQLLRAEDVARQLGLSRQHVYVMAASGELPSIKLRGAVRFDQKDVELFIREHRRGKGKAA
ncbi:MAG: helix-turn-helix domain-containing protein [Desulfobacteria bacterium]